MSKVLLSCKDYLNCILSSSLRTKDITIFFCLKVSFKIADLGKLCSSLVLDGAGLLAAVH